MISIASLWLPILLSSVGVFIVSSIIHMVLKYHQSDWSKLPAEDEIMHFLQKFDIPPGNYFMPHCDDLKGTQEQAYQDKLAKGPVALLEVGEKGPPNMGKSLGLWFLYSVLISVFAAYLTSRAVSADAHYLEVFRYAGTTAFGGYALAHLQESIWYKRNWSTTLKNMFDGFLYALVTAGVFGWLWPAA